MQFNLTKRYLYTLVIFTTVLFISCQKEFSIDNGNPGQSPDLSTKVSSSVSGFVTDENNAAVMGATVQFGTSTISTDKYGYFEAKNVQVVKNAAVVTVIKPGYFKGIKTYIGAEGKAAFLRIKLIPKVTAGTLNGNSGGVVSMANGLSITFPANSVVNASSNAAYSGTVNVAAYWLDPTATDLNNTMPGDLRGINTSGNLQLLTTYGMAAVELTGSGGELLQIAPGKKATLSLDIPASLLSSAPASIPLWYFDEAKGLWKEEGSATKTGNKYTGEVSHFSFWNYDVPGNYVLFDCTLKDVAGNPIPFALVRITIAGTGISACGYTNASGYVGGAVPNNAQLILDVYPTYNCGTSVYTQPFSTTTVNISLGVITVTNNIMATVSGTVTNCFNTPVSNGYVLISQGSYYSRYDLTNTGTFSFPTLLCTNNTAVSIIAQDLTAMQASSPIPYTLVYGNNALGNIAACGTQIQEYVNYTINGVSHAIANPPDFVSEVGYNASNIYISAYSGNSYVGISYTRTNTPPNILGNLTGFMASQLNDSLTALNPIPVNITEFGNIGQYVSGNFSGVMRSMFTPTTTYTITCNFRTKRNY
ncbi:MAG TPA: carboxypeptidase-like regulatory domain-containing protein [Ferruginibacter sp.]|nr:carboxypeptidase-like regulatory domain-containing protein [Ferruginibacter sp.]